MPWLVQINATLLIGNSIFRGIGSGRGLAARCVCTLVDSGIQDDRAYSLEWHLDPDAKILDKGLPRGERGRFLIEVMQLVRSRPQAEPAAPSK
jgi:hypothetical protein